MALAVLLAGCGGGETAQDEKRSAAFVPSSMLATPMTGVSPGYQPVTSVSSQFPPDLPARVVVAPSQPKLAAATSEEPTLTFEDESGNKLASFELEPIRGRGYPEPRVVLVARKIGDTAPAAPVRPSCHEATRCEYKLARSYSVTLSDERLAQLVARGDSIAVVARAMSLDVPRSVEIVFAVDDQVLSRKKVVLLTE